MRLQTLCVSIAALALFGGGCGDDDPVAVAPDLVLATFETNMTSTSPTPPTLPLAAYVEFGIESDPPDNTTDYPEPLILGDYAMTEAGETVVHRAVGTPGFGVVAGRLTDGIDESAYYSVSVAGVGASGRGGVESSLFDYPPGIERTGPDLAGYVVTGISITLDELSLTQEMDGRWTVAVEITGAIVGRRN